ncbi:hypothetical protein ACFSTC_59620 [Nonomuraea ferruginea]
MAEVTVVGGGVGGMACALLLARRGARGPAVRAAAPAGRQAGRASP